jgi:hypothetical protein
MNEAAIRDRLVEHGRILFQAAPAFVEFTHVRDADVLLNDLGQYPHAFVLACIMDRQIKAERAWIIPYRIAEKLPDFTLATLSKQSLNDIKGLMGKPFNTPAPQPERSALPRFVSRPQRSVCAFRLRSD